MRVLVIEKAAVKQNIRVVKRRAGGAAVYGVLSGDAGGAGIAEMAELLRAEGIGRFAVSEAEEAEALRKAGFVDEEILMLRSTTDREVLERLVDLNVVCTISSVDTGLALNALAENRSTVAEAHIQVDTGMGFGGFLVGEPEKILLAYRSLPNVALSGIYTQIHAAPAGQEAEHQLQQFQRVLDAIHAAGFETGTVHAAGSYALMHCDLARMDAVRAGSVLLGRCRRTKDDGLSTVGHGEAGIAEMRWLPKGHTVGAEKTAVLKAPTRVAVVPVGYQHGFGVERPRPAGLLGTLGGGNAVIAPIMLPIMASLGVTPTVVATLFKVAGEIGLILGPLTGVTLITMEVTGLSYGELMIQAAIPFAVFWLAGAWVGANRAQKRTFGKEGYALGEDVQHLDQVVITPRQKRTTVAFLISFVLLVGYGIATKQGTNYALMVMIVLAAVVAIFGGIEIDRSVDCITKGVASQANMFLIFVSIDVLLNLVTLGGGFDALSNLLGGLAGNSPTAVMLVASVVGGFGIEAAAVAEIQIITDMFGGLATQVGLPMGCFAVSILAATRLTGSAYPTTNFAGQLGTAQCSNTKEALQACWISVAFACVFVVAYSFIGPLILG